MENKTKKILKTMIVGALGLSVMSATTHAATKGSAVEKCYGIVKKAKNDCGTPKHACAGQSNVNGSKNEWMFVMKGNCDRIVGGSLAPENGDKKQ